MGGEWPADWHRAKIGDIADVNWGDTNVTKKSYVPSGYVAYSATGPDGYLPYYDFNRTGIVVSAIGAQCGRSWLAKGKWSCIKNTLRFWSVNPEVDTEFLYWATRNPSTWPKRGSAQPFISQGDARAVEIAYPPLPEQRAIARVLGALDDRIELNRRMNETLEAMAQALFKSWFVDFDPVVVNALRAGNPIPEKFAERAAHYRENPHALRLPADILHLFPNRFTSSDLGPIPEGWEVKKLGDVIEILDSKRVPLNSRERTARRGPYPYYGATGVMDYVDDYLFDGTYILVGEDGSVIDERGHPVTQYVWGRFWVNNHAHVLKGRGISNELLYLILKNATIRAFITGAVQPKLSQKNLKAIPLIHSGEKISQIFSSEVGDYFRSIRFNGEQNHTLSALRDTLLPKLISGELRIPDVEKILEDVE